jgi:pantoate kinase
MDSSLVRRGAAFAPGHVTGVFVPDLNASDPRGRGSRGVGLVLARGAVAEVEWRGDRGPGVRVRDRRGARLPITEEAVRRLSSEADGFVRVRVRHELPVGQGFSMSAAGTLAASLAVAHVLERPRQRAVEVAHLAELYGRGGLGGVSAILGGGLEVRSTPGIPPWGQVAHRSISRRVIVGTVGGPLPSPALLGDPRFLARVASRGAVELDRLGSRPGWDDLLAASERFTDSLGLAPRPLRGVVRDVRALGARAAQAMFGQSFFAYAPTPAVRTAILEYLGRKGLWWTETRLAGRGPRLLRASPATLREPSG